MSATFGRAIVFIATYIADQTFDASMLSDVAFEFDGDSTAGRLVSGSGWTKGAPST
ncbi:hypothetical protein P0F65_02625 [Sphingomonas sp. I4]